VTELRTDRLELRRWREDDLDAYAAIVADREVGRHLGGPQNRATAWRQIAIFMGHREMRGWTSAPVVERATGRLVGRAGLWRPEGWPGVEMGWIFARDTWGLGYATEVGVAMRDYAFGELGIPHLVSLIAPDNTASIRVAVKIGSAFEGQHDLNGSPHLIYGQEASQHSPRGSPPR